MLQDDGAAIGAVVVGNEDEDIGAVGTACEVGGVAASAEGGDGQRLGDAVHGGDVGLTQRTAVHLDGQASRRGVGIVHRRQLLLPHLDADGRVPRPRRTLLLRLHDARRAVRPAARPTGAPGAGHSTESGRDDRWPRRKERLEKVR